MNNSKRARLPLTLLSAMLMASGCGEVTGLDGRAQIDTEVEGSESATSAEAREGPAAESATSSEDSSDGSEATGTIEVRARVFVQASGGEWREITQGSSDQQVRIDGADGLKLLSRTAIEAGEYIKVRIEFERVSANVTSGLWVGLIPLTGQIQVDAGGDGSIAVEREIGFTARANARTRVRIALNGAAWLERASASARTVSEADFRGAVGIVVE